MMKQIHQERTSAGWKRTKRWVGTSMIYAASGKESVALSGDYDVICKDAAGKQANRARARAVKDAADRKLRHQLLMISGPDMSARQVVTTLKALVRTIETEGLDIERIRDVQEVPKQRPAARDLCQE
jgi:hypothetical protein